MLVLAGIFHKSLLQHTVSTQSAKRLVVGENVSDFEITDLSGKVVKLSGQEKRTESGVVRLTFWCTTCHSCRMMDALIQKLAAEWKDKATIVGIDANVADTAAKVEDFIRAKRFSVPVLLDPESKAAELFGIRLTTTTLVIDRAGRPPLLGAIRRRRQPLRRQRASRGPRRQGRHRPANLTRRLNAAAEIAPVARCRRYP